MTDQEELDAFLTTYAIPVVAPLYYFFTRNVSVSVVAGMATCAATYFLYRLGEEEENDDLLRNTPFVRRKRR